MFGFMTDQTEVMIANSITVENLRVPCYVISKYIYFL